MPHDDFRLVAAKARDLLGVAIGLDIKLKKKTANEVCGPCPKCGGTDRFIVNKNMFNCRGCGAHGDVIDLVRHFTGCDFNEALEYLTGEARKPNGSANGSTTLAQDAHPNAPEGDIDPDDEARQRAYKSKPQAVYIYTNEIGTPLYEKQRFEWVDSGGRHKSFVSKGIKKTERVPYALPRLETAIAGDEPVFIVEGEKAADVLLGWGLCGTTADTGSSKWPEELNGRFRNADVVILPDNDEPGFKHAQNVGRALLPYAKSVRVLELPELPDKGDVYDWDGGSAEKLFDLVKEYAKPWAPARPASRYGALIWEELDNPGPEIEWLVDDLLTAQDRSLLGGISQSGKTFFALHVAMCIATDRPIFGHRVNKPGLVIYQAGESAWGVKKRMRAWRQHFDIDPKAHIPIVLLSSKINLYERDASTGLVAEIEAWKAYYHETPLRLLVIDTLAKASLGVEENSAKEMGIVLDNSDDIARACKCHVMLIHHMNAGGKDPRGSTAIRANLDEMLSVTVDEKTKLRTVTNNKQKEEAEAEPFNFELMRVILGSRADGKLITSCVALPPGEKAEFRKIQREGFQLKEGPEDLAFRALWSALERKGQSPPDGLQCPSHVKVVDRKVWLADFRRIAPYDNDDPEIRLESARRALRRVEDRFQKFNIIGKDDAGVIGSFVWWTGKPIRGFKETFPRLKAEADQEPDGPSIDIGDIV